MCMHMLATSMYLPVHMYLLIHFFDHVPHCTKDNAFDLDHRQCYGVCVCVCVRVCVCAWCVCVCERERVRECIQERKICGKGGWWGYVMYFIDKFINQPCWYTYVRKRVYACVCVCVCVRERENGRERERERKSARERARARASQRCIEVVAGWKPPWIYQGSFPANLFWERALFL